MEGRWNGEMITVPNLDEEVRVCSAELIFNEQQGKIKLLECLVSSLIILTSLAKFGPISLSLRSLQ